MLNAQQWRQIIDSARETAIISLDTEGRVTSWSRGAHTMLGWEESEMLGQTLDRIFEEQDRRNDLLGREFADARSEGRGGGSEGWRLRKDGSRVWATGEVCPICDEQGSIVGFVKIVRNRTEQREAEEEVREERRALEILNRAGSQLALENDLQQLV